MKFLETRVETYSGYKADERPTAFVLGGRRHVVVEVLDRWYQGGLSAQDQKMDYFKVKTGEGLEFILRYNALFDAWSVLASEEESG
ncbi:MAG: hypothetical protein AB1641_27200 [Thermodesulfobacteriota bacterium]